MDLSGKMHLKNFRAARRVKAKICTIHSELLRFAVRRHKKVPNNHLLKKLLNMEGTTISRTYRISDTDQLLMNHFEVVSILNLSAYIPLRIKIFPVPPMIKVNMLHVPSTILPGWLITCVATGADKALLANLVVFSSISSVTFTT
jgi:hypothetical protein